MITPPIESLFLRYRDHQDLEALGQIYDRTAPQLLSLARRLAGPRGQPEDLVQETFLIVIERPGAWDGRRPLGPWLLGILAHKAQQARHNAGRIPDAQRLAASEVATPAALAQAAEFQLNVQLGIDSLTPLFRETLQAALVEDRGPSQLAVDLGVQPGTLRQRLRRGLALLRLQLQAGLSALWFCTPMESKSLAAGREHIMRAASKLLDPAHHHSATQATPSLPATKTWGTPAVLSLASLATLVLGAAWWMGSTEARSTSIGHGQTSTAAIRNRESALASSPQTTARRSLASLTESRASNANSLATPGHVQPATDGPSATVRIVDRTGKPLAHLHVGMRPYQTSLAERTEAWTDARGEISIPHGVRPMELVFHMGRRDFAAHSVEPPTFASFPIESSRNTILLERGPLQYIVSATLERRRVDFVNATSGEPLTGQVYAVLETESWTGPNGMAIRHPLASRTWLLMRHFHPLRDGGLYLGSRDSVRPSDRLVFWMQGFEVWSQENPVDFFGAGSRMQTVRLQPSRWDPISLNLVDRDGVELAYGFVILQDEDTRRVLYSGFTDGHGWVRNMPWLGGNVSVRLAKSLWGAVEILCTLPASDLAAQQDLQVELPMTLGSVVVESVPSAATELCLLGSAEYQHLPIPAPQNGRSTMAGLLPGKYLIGTRTMVNQAFPQAQRSHYQPTLKDGWHLTVKSGETTHVPWKSEWHTPAKLSGRIELRGAKAPFQPYLIAIYEDLGTLPFLDPQAPAIRVAPDGNYVIEDGTRPHKLVLVVPMPGSRLHALAILDPGSSITIDLATIDISAPKGVPPGTFISYDVPRGSALASGLNRFTRPWIPGRKSMTLHNIPRSLTHIYVGKPPVGVPRLGGESIDWSASDVGKVLINNALPPAPGIDASMLPSSGFFSLESTGVGAAAPIERRQ